MYSCEYDDYHFGLEINPNCKPMTLYTVSSPTITINKEYNLHILAKRSFRYWFLFIGLLILICSGVCFLYCCLGESDESDTRKIKPIRYMKIEKEL